MTTDDIKNKNFIVTSSKEQADKLVKANFTMFHKCSEKDGSETFYFVNEPKKFVTFSAAEMEKLNCCFTNMLGF